MSERSYINEDGSVKADIIAHQQAALAASAQVHGVEDQYLETLLSEVQ